MALNDSSESLVLTDVEQDLRLLLLDVARYINPLKSSELRFTGGWVRDKMLGIQSHDIDVAISDLTGYHFGLRMKDFLSDPERAQRYNFADQSKDGTSTGVHHIGLHKIEANPEKSKHLETVATRIFGLEIDLVNLRKETYTEDSRNPQMEFGTAEEDAMRRDATINAMFYNLRTQEVEDFTGKGKDDLKNGIIRTPLDPFQTFTDDPLRILRLIRFAGKFDYKIDEAARLSMQDPSVKDALRKKITRERVGVEIEKMLRGPRPLLSLKLIDELGLYDTIFIDPTQKDHYQPSTKNWHVTNKLANSIVNPTHNELSDLLITTDIEKYLTWLLSTIVPYADAPLPESDAKSNKGKSPLATEVIREGIKAANRSPLRAWDTVTASVRNFESIRDTKDEVIRHKRPAKRPDVGVNDPLARDTLGMKIRRWGTTWRLQVTYALLVEATQNFESERDFIKEYQTFLEHIKDLDLYDVCYEKPILGGKQLTNALQVAPGPWLASALDVVMAWQLRNPSSADTEAALEVLRSSNIVPCSKPENNKKVETGEKRPQNDEDSTKEDVKTENGEEVTRKDDDTKKAAGELLTLLISHFLQLTIRPLFSKTKTQHDERVTPQGRSTQEKVLTGELRRNLDVNDDEVTKPWKLEQNFYALALLNSSVQRLDVRSTEILWPLLVPPVLGVIDDTDVLFKIGGCKLLTHLLRATPPELLSRTGLGPVFHDAITPCLYFLPSLTPEPESGALLDAAYNALLQLHLTRFPPQYDPDGLPPSPTDESMKNLSNILHTHILPSISHVITDNPMLIQILLKYTNTLVRLLGETTITHLQYLIPILNTLLDRPFVASLPGIEDRRVISELMRLVPAAARTIQFVLAEAWPRAMPWAGELLKGVCGCWVQLDWTSSSRDTPNPDPQAQAEAEAAQYEAELTNEEARDELARVVQMLVNIEDAVVELEENGMPTTLPGENGADSKKHAVRRGEVLEVLSLLADEEKALSSLLAAVQPVDDL